MSWFSFFNKTLFKTITSPFFESNCLLFSIKKSFTISASSLKLETLFKNVCSKFGCSFFNSGIIFNLKKLRSYLVSKLLLSVLNLIFSFSAKPVISFLVKFSKGLTMFPVFSGIPFKPLIPAPRVRFIKIVFCLKQEAVQQTRDLQES